MPGHTRTTGCDTRTIICDMIGCTSTQPCEIDQILLIKTPKTKKPAPPLRLAGVMRVILTVLTGAALSILP